MGREDTKARSVSVWRDTGRATNVPPPQTLQVELAKTRVAVVTLAYAS